MQRQQFEKYQVWFYLPAILAGLGTGSAAPGLAPLFEAVLWPVLGLLLYSTFTQVALIRLPEAFRDIGFMGAILTGNFVLIPLLVWGLLGVAPDDPAFRLGLLLVLLMPCTDWYITFTHLGAGDTRRATAVTPFNLLVQFALLPLYLWLLLGETFVEILAADRIAIAFGALIVLPLTAAVVTERWAERRPERSRLVEHLWWLPVPLLATVLFLVAASQVQAVIGSLPVLGHLFGVFVGFLIGAAAIGVAIARIFRLSGATARAVLFSLGTRNSFVVLPLALALPDAWQAAAIVIVFQSLVELFGMVAYVWAVPRLLVPRKAD